MFRQLISFQALSLLALLEKLGDFGMSFFTVSFALSFFPDGSLLAVHDPADLNGSGFATRRVRIDLHIGEAFHKRSLESVGRASVPSRTTVLDVDLGWHVDI